VGVGNEALGPKLTNEPYYCTVFALYKTWVLSRCSYTYSTVRTWVTAAEAQGDHITSSLLQK
jgi:hypothetical protein